MMTIKEMMDKIHATAKAKGWWETARDFGEVCALIHSELSEALECWRDGELVTVVKNDKPEGFFVELADAVIRIYDTLHSKGLGPEEGDMDTLRDDQARAEIDREDYPGKLDTVGAQLALAHSHVSEAFSAHLTCEPDESDYSDEGLVGALEVILAIFNEHEVDAYDTVLQKMAYNETRPYRHGGKRA